MCLCALYYSYMYIDLTVYLWICMFILIESRFSFLWRKESCQDLNLSTSVRTPRLFEEQLACSLLLSEKEQAESYHPPRFVLT